MTIQNSIVAKLSVAVVAVAMAFTLVAPAAKAQDVSSMSLEQLVALVNQLQGQLSGSAATGSCSFTFTRSLTKGSTGADVMNLQKFLNMSADTQVAAAGVAGGPGAETSYYGPATAAAVSKFQVKYSADILVPSGLTSPTGYFGPASMAKANALCKAGTGTGTGTGSTGELKGGAGDIADADFITSLNNEEVGEGEDDVEVAGLEIEAKGSDIELAAVNLNFDWADTGSSDDFDDYASEVSIWLDGEELARVDVEDMDDDDWSENVSLDKGGIIREGETGDLVVAVSGASNIDGTDLGTNWNVSFDSVRFRDAQGATVTESSVGEIGAANDDDASTDTGERQFSFESFATSHDIELKISKGNEEINDSRLLQVDEDGDSEAVEVFSFMVEVEGDSDLTVDEIVSAASFTGTSTQLNDVFGELRLVMDGEEIGSENAPAATSVTFDDLDLVLEAGEEYEFVIEVDILEYVVGGTYGLNDTVAMSIGQTQREAWDVEDEEGDDLANTDRTGSASTEAHSFTLSDVIISGFNWNSPSAGNLVEFSFTVEADDDDFTFATSTSYTVSGTATTSAPSWIITSGSADVTAGSGTYTVEEGGKASFKMIFPVNGTNGNYLTITLPSVAGVQVPTDKQSSPTVTRNVQ